MTAALLTACGTARPGPAGARPLSPGPGQTAQASGPPSGSRAEALSLARELLSRLVLPPGSEPGSGPLPASLRGPAIGGAGPGSVDSYRLFTLVQSMTAAQQYLLTHVPSGLQVQSSGQGSGPAGDTMREVGYALRTPPAGIDQAGLVVTVVPGPGQTALLRADAQVVWFPARSAAEHLDPAGFGAVTISATVYNAKQHTVRRMITSRAVIARLARLLNGLPAAPPGTYNCPASGASYRFAFAAAGRGRDLIAATDGCADDRITVGGTAQPPLLDRSGRLLTAAEHLLHIHPRL